ncbi:hypothetical protein ASE63_08035 [Bosea sp. Root381]|uniref:ATP dependent DNA ligase n=1 Tax=Bosea sp. Root381 TaxID=1736524 RepID=UPI0006FBDDB4|nr:hypothetical protein [Bosea sp. Root381]KRE02298.1 hypothetical protein ASE63_08035 [Bosea sp. Root381]
MRSPAPDTARSLLYLNGQDLRSLPLGQRRELLGDALARARHSSLRFSEEVDADSDAFLDLACKLGLEGIIAKDRDAPYRPGRGGDWRKIKCVQSETFVIVGYEPSTADAPYRPGRGGDWRKIKCVQSETFVIVGYEPSTVALGGIGRLLLAARKGEGLAYVGGVGTGFTAKVGTALRKQLAALKIDKPAVTMKRKGVIWVSPELPAEIAFRGWTDDGKLRHASFKGLREDADEAAVFEIG